MQYDFQTHRKMIQELVHINQIILSEIQDEFFYFKITLKLEGYQTLMLSTFFRVWLLLQFSVAVRV